MGDSVVGDVKLLLLPEDSDTSFKFSIWLGADELSKLTFLSRDTFRGGVGHPASLEDALIFR